MKIMPESSAERLQFCAWSSRGFLFKLPSCDKDIKKKRAVISASQLTQLPHTDFPEKEIKRT